MAVIEAKVKVTKKAKSKKKITKKATKTTVKKKVSKKKSTKKVNGVSVPVGEYNLVIVESPSKAKTIKKYLGRGYQVVASNGHIKDLPKSKLGVDVKAKFAIELVPITGKKTVIDKIAILAKNADKIYLAPDPDREGEAIAFHLAEEIGKKKNIYRVLFNAVTKSAILKAMESPTELDSDKYDSQKTRRILDRLVGYKISPILWDKVQRGLSAGRVQSVALRIIVEREQEIEKFVPEQWFSIGANLKHDDIIFPTKYYGDLINKKNDLVDIGQVNKILNDVNGVDFKVCEIKKRERKQNPTPPFTTSKLQQEAVNKLGFSTKKTMMVAQKLYEGVNIGSEGLQGLITYMRTDSVRTEPEFLTNIRQYIGERYGNDFLPQEAIIYKKKGKGKVQDAHEAIRPTNLEYTPESVKSDLTDDEYKLYSMIWNKFVSSQMAQAIIDQTAVMFDVNGHFFKSNGSVIKFTGFRAVYLEAEAEKRSRRGDDDDDDEKVAEKNNILPLINQGDIPAIIQAPNSEEHWTSPPPRFNEASLVKELEEKGIGRPSTYAAIISNLQNRSYVDKNENRFIPTELGTVICKMLVESFPNEMDVEFTARIEEQLDQIEEGSIKYTKVLKDFWLPFEKTLEKAKEEMKNLKRQEIPTGIKCTKCGDAEFFIKWGRNGQFLACSRYPECTGTEDFKKHLDGSLEIIPKKFFRDKCPECGNRLVVKKGKYGRFVACEEYPNCKTTLPYTLDVNCPECKTGKFAEKRSRYGKPFYGCSNYPDCNNAMWTLPRDFGCESCGYPVMGERETKRLGRHLQCPKCKHTVSIEETPFAEKDE